MNEVLSKISVALTIIIIGITNFVLAEGTTTGCMMTEAIDAPITIEEFADFECEYCVLGSNTMKEVLKNYPGKINLVFRNMPLSAHQNSLAAAKAFSAVCLQSSSLAYLYQKELFENQDKISTQGEPFLYEVAKRLGVDMTKMKSDMNSDTVAKSIAEDQQLAESHNFKGTPSFMIGTEPIVGAVPYDEIKKVIDKQLRQ